MSSRYLVCSHLPLSFSATFGLQKVSLGVRGGGTLSFFCGSGVIIVRRNMSHTFSFNLFDFLFSSFKTCVSHFPHFLFLRDAIWPISHSYSRIYVVLVWKLSLKSREIGGTALVEMKLILNLFFIIVV